MTKISQEAVCDHAHLTYPLDLEVTPESVQLFNNYQAAFILAIAVKRCGYSGPRKPTVVAINEVDLVTSEALHEHGQARPEPLLLCGHGIDGAECPAKQGPSQNNEHVADQSEEW